nr:uncharacterized protein LOC126523536 isoform X1 [Dermacentor andersoni]
MFSCNNCEFKSGTLVGYCRHFGEESFCSRTIPCVHVCCSHQFMTYAALRCHILRKHPSKSPLCRPSLELRDDFLFLCSAAGCVKDFQNRATLLKHLYQHLRSGVSVQCPFRRCGKLFQTTSSLSCHLSRNHGSKAKANEQVSLVPPNEIEGPEGATSVHDTGESMETAGPTNEPAYLELRQCAEHELALFYLKLEAKLMVPSSTVQVIAESILRVHNINRQVTLLKLREQLEKKMARRDASEIASEVDTENIFKAPCSLFSTEYKRKAYFKEILAYVAPINVRLGRDKYRRERSFQYIPILETLAKLLTSKEVAQFLYDPQPPGVEGELADITDGLICKSNSFLTSENVLQIVLYQDAFEVANPLGSARKKHKLVGVYYTLANFSIHNRSSRDHIQLALLCLESDLKQFGQEKIFGLLLNDLVALEKDGIHHGDSRVKGTVIAILGDNVGSHFIGGFQENFSLSNYFCRYCLITRIEFQHKPYLTGEKRTPANYNQAVSQAENSGLPFEGVKCASIFNKLDHFHVCNPGLPPCIGHDLFEGVVSYDMLLFLKYFAENKRWLTFQYLNYRIMNFKYKGADARSKPCEVNARSNKLGGEAVRTWVLFRLLPAMIGHKIQNGNDPVWRLYLNLRKIVDIVCAPVITEGQSAYLSIIIQEYLEDRWELFPSEPLKPKHHYMLHYASMQIHFGPLINVWTLRFESKHSFFKNCVRSSKNFKAVAKTLAEKHQLLQAFLYSEAFFGPDISFKSAIPFCAGEYSANVQACLAQFNLEPGTSVASRSVVWKGTDYTVGDFVALNLYKELCFGEISLFVVKNRASVFVAVKVYQANFLPHLHYYVLRETNTCSALPMSDLADYSPLPAYDIRAQKIIVLKHMIHGHHGGGAPGCGECSSELEC